MRIYVNGHGWVMGVTRDDDNNVTGVRFTKWRAGAKPFKGDWQTDEEVEDVLRYIEGIMKCHVDKVGKGCTR